MLVGGAPAEEPADEGVRAALDAEVETEFEVELDALVGGGVVVCVLSFS